MKRQLTFLLLALALLIGCGGPGAHRDLAEATSFSEAQSNQVKAHEHEVEAHAHTYEQVEETAVTSEMQVVLVPSEIAIGPNRMAVGLLHAENRMIHEATVHFHYFDLSDSDAPRLEKEADAHPVHTSDGLTTIFAQERTFERAGVWGLEVQANLADGATAVQRIKFTVNTDSRSLHTHPGRRKRRLQPDHLRLGTHPAFYQLSLEEALGNGKPTVLLLATPAFCQTRFCGPAYKIISELEAEFGDTANFIHVEVYSGLPDPSQNDWELAPVMATFGLRTEPWVYVIDETGTIVYRAEGVFTAEDTLEKRP